MRKKKFSAPLRVKGTGEEGAIECVFATMETGPDHDNDLTKRGAFGTQENVVLESWNHGRDLPVGKGRVFERGQDAVFEGRIFTETRNGRDHYEALKALAADGGQIKFSYTFNILDSERRSFNGRPGRVLKRLEVVGISPVQSAAGLQTRLLYLKGAGGLSSKEFGRYIDGLLQQNLLDRLARMEKRVKDLTPPPSRLDVAQQRLVDGGHSERLARAIIGAEVEALIAERARLDPFYHQNEVIARQRARTVVMRELESPVA